ncbi:unnamed protein product, partial [Callosobruchus maculatus]
TRSGSAARRVSLFAAALLLRRQSVRTCVCRAAPRRPDGVSEVMLLCLDDRQGDDDVDRSAATAALLDLPGAGDCRGDIRQR